MAAIHSMTGYASASADLGGTLLNLEIKGVNSRFLDVVFRLADELRSLEMGLRERLAERVTRGKLECRVYLQSQAGAVSTRMPNGARLAELASLEQAVLAQLPLAPRLSVAEALRWPGVLEEPQSDLDALHAAVLAGFSSALDEFAESRRREGAKLAAVLGDKASQMRALVAGVAPAVPAAIASYQERLGQRLREAVATLDEDRIRQEVGVFAAKVDVAEELARLNTHLDEVERVLARGGAVGKRLDFLMQELNREANTLASKSVSAEVTAVALELKLLIEQMREQVQNLE